MTTTSKASAGMFATPYDVQRLHAGEDVLPALGSRAADVQLAEGRVGEHLAVGPQRLLEDLLAVRDEQQRRSVAGVGLHRPPVVERGDDRLAGPGRGDDQVAVAVVDVALDVQIASSISCW